MFDIYSHRLFARLRGVICLTLSASLLLTSADAAQIASSCFPASFTQHMLPRVVRPPSHPAFFTEQALVQRLIFPRRVSASISEGSLYRQESLGTALSDQPEMAFKPLVSGPFLMVAWIFRAGKYGYMLLNEWTHLIVAFMLAPLQWSSIFTAENMRGHQGWREFWMEGILSGHLRISHSSNPKVVLPVQKGLRDFLIRKGGALLSAAPAMALMWHFVNSGTLSVIQSSALLVIVPFVAGLVGPLAGSLYSDVFRASNEPGVYDCGDVALLAHFSVSFNDARMALESMIDAAANRGHISGGIVTHLDTRVRWKSFWSASTVRTRVNNYKRGNLTRKLMSRFLFRLGAVVTFLFLTAREVTFGVAKIFHAHVRYPTWAIAKSTEAHPLRGGKPRWDWVWEIDQVQNPQTGAEESRLARHLRRVEDYLTHNGDFNAWIWRGHEYGSRTIAHWMDRVLYARSTKPWAQTLFKTVSAADTWARRLRRRKIFMGIVIKPFVNLLASVIHVVLGIVKWWLEILDGDTPRLAKLVHFHHTQGRSEASLELAYQYVIAKDFFDEVPPESLFKETGTRFDALIEKYSSDPKNPLIGGDAAHLTQADPAKLAALTEELARVLATDPGWATRITGTPEERISQSREMALKAVYAFLKNDLLTAQQFVMQRFVGTGGVVSSSTLAKDRIVATSYKQEIYLGLSKEEEISRNAKDEPVLGVKMAGISSDWAAIKAGPFENAVYANPLGESIELIMGQDGAHANFYPLKQDPESDSAILIPLTEAEIQARIEPLKGNRFIHAIMPKQGNQSIQNSLDAAASALKHLKESFNPPEGTAEKDLPLNAQTMEVYAKEFLAIGLTKAIKKRVPRVIDHFAVNIKLHDVARQIAVALLDGDLNFEDAEKRLRDEAFAFNELMERREVISMTLGAQLSPEVKEDFELVIRYNSNLIFTRWLAGQIQDTELTKQIKEEAQRIKALETSQQKIKEQLVSRLDSISQWPRQKEDLLAMVRETTEGFWKDLYKEYPSAEKIEETEALVAEKIFELRFNPQNKKLHNATLSVHLAFQAALREMAPGEASPQPIDVLYIGLEDSDWVSEQSIQDQQKMFRDATFYNLKSESVNAVLLSLKEQANRPDFQIRLPAGIITNQTLIVAFSQSGVTFPTWHSINRLKQKRKEDEAKLEFLRELSKHGNGRIFAVTGELDTPLGRVFQKFTKDADFSKHIFITNVERQESEARSQSAMVMHALGTEILINIADVIRGLFPGTDPLDMRLEQADIRELKKMRDHVIEKGMPAITGVDAAGEKKENPVHEQLVARGNALGWDILDAWVGRTALVLYVVATVAFGVVPLGMGLLQAFGTLGIYISSLPVLQVGLQASPHLLHVVQILSHIGTVPWAIHAAHGFDAFFYIFISPFAIYFLRFVMGRMIMARLGARKLFIADIPHVANPVAMFITKLFALSFGSASVIVKAENPRTDFVSMLAHEVSRGDAVLVLMPDGRLVTLKGQEDAVVQSVKHLLNTKNFGGNVQLFGIGPNPDVEEHFDEFIRLPSIADSPDPNTPLKRLRTLQLLKESRFDALNRMAAGFVIGHAMVKRVSFNGRLFKYWKTKAGAGAATTAYPVAAMSILWEYLARKSVISYHWAQRLAFSEGILFFGLIVSLPLSLMNPASVEAWRLPLVVLSSLIFGFLGHWRVTTWKNGEPADGGPAGFWNRAGLALLGFGFQIPYLLQSQGPWEALFWVLLVHAAYDWFLFPLLSGGEASAPSGVESAGKGPPQVVSADVRHSVHIALETPTGMPATSPSVDPIPSAPSAAASPLSRPNSGRREVTISLSPVSPTDPGWQNVAPLPAIPAKLQTKAERHLPQWIKIGLMLSGIVNLALLVGYVPAVHNSVLSAGHFIWIHLFSFGVGLRSFFSWRLTIGIVGALVLLNLWRLRRGTPSVEIPGRSAMPSRRAMRWAEASLAILLTLFIGQGLWRYEFSNHRPETSRSDSSGLQYTGPAQDSLGSLTPQRVPPIPSSGAPLQVPAISSPPLAPDIKNASPKKPDQDKSIVTQPPTRGSTSRDVTPREILDALNAVSGLDPAGTSTIEEVRKAVQGLSVRRSRLTSDEKLALESNLTKLRILQATPGHENIKVLADLLSQFLQQRTGANTVRGKSSFMAMMMVFIGWPGNMLHVRRQKGRRIEALMVAA